MLPAVLNARSSVKATCVSICMEVKVAYANMYKIVLVLNFFSYRYASKHLFCLGTHVFVIFHIAALLIQILDNPNKPGQQPLSFFIDRI